MLMSHELTMRKPSEDSVSDHFHVGCALIFPVSSLREISEDLLSPMSDERIGNLMPNS